MNLIIDSLKNLDEQSRKKLMIFGIGFVGIIILIIIISIIVSIVNRRTPYEDMEEIMEKAAYNYYQQNLGQLPTETVKTSVISAQTLVEQEYMKEISKYTKDESCSGNVIVTYYDGEYDYQGYLTCNDFTTSLLTDKIKKDNAVITSGAGLYDESGVLRFRGEHVNNYLKVDDVIYRIMKIDTENKIYLTPETMNYNDLNVFVYWDDRYNTEAQSSCGINDYSLSRVRDTAENIYKNLNKNLKDKTTTFTACVANRADNNTDNSGNVECSKVLEKVNVSLIPIYEYIKASIAPSCTMPASKECKNYNYLYMDESGWWSGTGDATNTDKIYGIKSNGEIEKNKGYTRMLARYVIALKPNTLFKTGEGTLEKPYEIR